MQWEKIAHLVEHDPLRGRRVNMAKAETNFAKASVSLTQAKEDFVDCYARPHYGWEIARSFAHARQTFPLLLKGMDGWVYKAYLMTLDPETYYNHHIADAYAMWDAVIRSKYAHDYKAVSAMPGGVLMSLILMCATTKSEIPSPKNYQDIASHMQLPYATVCAFASLYYDMIDRAIDGKRIALASDVYPDGRIEEQREDYFDRVRTVDILKRIGYNGGEVEAITWAGGMGDKSYVSKLTSADGAEADFTKTIIGNGLLLARTVGVNSRHIGVNRATHLISASRQAGGIAEEPVLSNLFPRISSALQQANDTASKRKREIYKETELNQ